MMRRRLVYFVPAILAIFLISGCETTQKKYKEEVTGIKTRVETLESRVEGIEAKQVETEKATSEQMQAMEELKEAARQKMARSNVTTNVGVKTRGGKSRGRIKDIQICLQNAGFYNGKIDGVKGRNTRRAIRDFQKANDLRADGIVGKKTWELLSKYLSGSAGSAQSAAYSEEGATK